MDFLQGYGSDDESHSSSSSSSLVEERRTDNNSLNAKTNNDLKVTATKTTATATAKTTSSSKSLTSKSNNNDYKRKKKGTKILKLNSVLPPDILERLTRSTVQHAASSAGSKSNNISGTNTTTSWNKYDYDSSDDSSDDNSNNDNNNNDNNNRRNKKGDTSTSKKSFLTQRNNNNNNDTHKNIGGDLGLDSLLSDLQSVVPTSSTSKVPKPNSKNNDNGTSKMGLAFMNVSNTVVRTKKNSLNSVVDIHGSNHIEVEDVHSDDDNDNDTNEANHLSSNDAIPLFPSSRKRPPNEEENNINRNTLSNTVGNQYKNSNFIKRPRHTVTAAPTVPSNFQTLKVPSYNTHHDTSLQSTISNQQQHYHQQHQQQQQQQQYYQNEQQINQSTIKQTKMSKRELEKALRSGNFDAIDSSNITQSIDTSTYNTPSENELLATASTSNPNGSQYRTSNLQMYVPSEGTSVATGDVSSKQRSKHQIHSLVANARKLEADRARLGAMGLGGRKSNRADAKKKYGW